MMSFTLRVLLSAQRWPRHTYVRFLLRGFRILLSGCNKKFPGQSRSTFGLGVTCVPQPVCLDAWSPAGRALGKVVGSLGGGISLDKVAQRARGVYSLTTLSALTILIV